MEQNQSVLNVQPIFSVIVPTYNRAELLKEVVQNLLQQTFEDFELIVINDGSKDHTWEVLQNIEDPRVVPINQKNTRQTQARRNGLKHAKGKYFAFCDSDDMWDKDFLKSLHDLFTKHDADYIFTNYQVEGESRPRIDLGDVKTKHWLEQHAYEVSDSLYHFKDLYGALFDFQPIFTSCQALTRKHFEHIGGVSEQINNKERGTVLTSEDSHIIRRSGLTTKSYFFNRVLVTLGRQGDNMSSSYISNLRGGIYILRDILATATLSNEQQLKTQQSIQKHIETLALQLYYFCPPSEFRSFYLENPKSSYKWKTHIHFWLSFFKETPAPEIKN